MSKKMSRYPHDAKVYVGELGNNASKQEIEDAFSYYGPLRNVWVARNPPGFAFVEFEDARDAEDSVRGLDGRTICGRRARVELSTGKGGRGLRGGDRGGDRGRGGPPSSKSGRFHPDDRCYECGGRGHYARDCSRHGRGGGGSGRGRKRSRSRSPRSRSRELRTRSRSYSRGASRSRSRDRDTRDRRTRSKTPTKRDRTTPRERSVSRGHTKSPRRSVSKTRSRSRSRTPRSVSRSRSRSHRRNGDSHHD